MLHLTDATFDENTKTGVVLVDFYADRCGPCQMLGKLMPLLSEKYAGRATIAKVNTDTEFATTQRFGISALPTFVILKDGQEVERLRGLNQPEVYSQMIDKHLG